MLARGEWGMMDETVSFRDFSSLEALQKFGLSKGTIINVETLDFDNPDTAERHYYRVWYWRLK